MTEHVVVAGLAFGDEGKGQTTYEFVKRLGAKLVVRYNGGPQAGHFVVDDRGRGHKFTQVGAGTFAGASTLLSRFMVVEPYALEAEFRTLETLGELDMSKRVSIEEDCVVTTPLHWFANRLREAVRGVNRHGTLGLGIGEVRCAEVSGKDVLRVKLLKYPAVVHEFLLLEQKRYLEEFVDLFQVEGFRDLYSQILAFDANEVARFYEKFYHSKMVVSKNLLDAVLVDGVTAVFEGAQGVLLDETYGFQPHTTWTDCTFKNAVTLLNGRKHKTVGVTRTFMTRHGEGPLPSHNQDLKHRDPNNRRNESQGKMRFGHFDVPLLRYAIDSCNRHGRRVDELSITHLDCVTNRSFPYVDAYMNNLGGFTRSVGYCSDENMSLHLKGWKPIVAHTSEDPAKAISKLLNTPVGLKLKGEFLKKEVAV